MSNDEMWTHGSASVLVVDDDPSTRGLMRIWLEAAGFLSVEHEGGRSAVKADKSGMVAACVDLGLDDMSGIEVIQRLKADSPDLPVVVVTAETSLETAIEAMRAGAYDYVTKPLKSERLVHAVRRAAERYRMAADIHRLESELRGKEVLGQIVGQSPAMAELANQVSRVVESDVAVCLFGSSGTGKELVARAIHQGSRRARRPFVAINCAAIPESLQESELFGHEKGAFTGANSIRRGRFEQASGGTLFLDELGEMSASTQAALLRTLQEKTVRRVGGTAEIPVDVRIICATHRDLSQEVKEGRFREDLYYRLVVYPIHLPKLSERDGDVPLLVSHFLKRFAEDVGRNISSVSPEALEALNRHDWPGNVRELQNVVHRAMLACTGEKIGLADLPPNIRTSGLPSLPPESLPRTPANDTQVLPLEVVERRAIEHALAVANGSVGKAAKLLGLGRATLYRRLAKYEAAS